MRSPSHQELQVLLRPLVLLEDLPRRQDQGQPTSACSQLQAPPWQVSWQPPGLSFSKSSFSAHDSQKIRSSTYAILVFLSKYLILASFIHTRISLCLPHMNCCTCYSTSALYRTLVRFGPVALYPNVRGPLKQYLQDVPRITVRWQCRFVTFVSTYCFVQ